METLWFCLVAFMIVGYVVLDGFDLGAGAIHLFVARTDEERKQVIRTIGPVWDGNEVWLLAAGGTLYFAFPDLYASSFSGFYLPLMIVLWLLILRGCSIEFRSHLESATWKPLWDVLFAASSFLLTVFFGAALGNVVRGVPLNREGAFFLPLWTNFQTSGEAGILDWYTITVGLCAAAALILHGALWVRMKTAGEVARRSSIIATRMWWTTMALTAAVTVATFLIQPQVPASFRERPWGFIFPLFAAAAFFATFWLHRKGEEIKAFLGSSLFLTGMLGSVVFGVFPYVLPSNGDPKLGLTVYNSAAAHYGLEVGLIWWIPGMILATGYAVFVYRRFAGKVPMEGSEGYH